MPPLREIADQDLFGWDGVRTAIYENLENGLFIVQVTAAGGLSRPRTGDPGQDEAHGLGLGVQRPAAQTVSDVDFLGQVRDLGLGAWAVEQRLVEAHRIKGVKANALLTRVAARHCIGLQAP